MPPYLYDNPGSSKAIFFLKYAIFVLVLSIILLPCSAFAIGRVGISANPYTVYYGYAEPTGNDVIAIAEHYTGSGKFTRLPGPWCADAVSAWLLKAGKPPLDGRMAASALSYGPHVMNPQRNDLVVMATRHGRYGHVGLVVADLGDRIVMISGNWSHRVSVATLRKRGMTFIRT